MHKDCKDYTVIIINNLEKKDTELSYEKAKEIEELIIENILSSNNGEYDEKEILYLISKRKAEIILEKSKKSLVVYFENDKKEILAVGMIIKRDGHYEANTLNVRKGYKSTGLGQRICDIREEILKEMGVKELYIEALKFDRTLKFHKKRGFYETKPVRKLYYTFYMKKNIV